MLNELLHLPDKYFFRNFHYGNAGLQLNARISMAGYESPRQGNYCWNGLNRGSEEFILWQLGLAGMGELRFEDRTYVLNPGQAMLLKIPHDHCYQVYRESNEWKIIFIILRGCECMRIGAELINQLGPVSPSYNSVQVLRIANGIMNSDNENDPWKMSEAAYSLLMNMGAEYQTDSNLFPLSESLKKSRRFAMKNFTRNISVTEMAEAAGMSYSHFSREFTAHCRVSPGAFLLQLKLEKALNLLQTNALSIKEIASACGFSSVSYFCRAFSHKFNRPPGAFRNNN
ncbi:MAG: helix-turn-helix transcriptional regulator [Victivallales bacterium]|nr:helix-turn-helix transcriptional regulator [Victivallales bacterium]